MEPSPHRVESTLSLRLEPSQHHTYLNLAASSLYADPADDSASIVYTDLNNLQAIIAQQQQQLLSKLRAPVFVAPPPPPPPGGGGEERLNSAAGGHERLDEGEHEQSTSFMGGSSDKEDANWEWKVKIRPDGTRCVDIHIY